jgi:hypothetical protein
MGDSGYWYQFGTGIGEEELNRLEVQGAGIAPATRSVSSRSGKRASRMWCDAIAAIAAHLKQAGWSL